MSEKICSERAPRKMPGGVCVWWGARVLLPDCLAQREQRLGFWAFALDGPCSWGSLH